MNNINKAHSLLIEIFQGRVLAEAEPSGALSASAIIAAGAAVSHEPQAALAGRATPLAPAAEAPHPQDCEAKQIAQALGLKENLEELTPIEKTMIAWCKDKWGMAEYRNRIEAARKILNCYATNGTALDLSASKLTSLPELNLPSLQELDLWGNSLSSLPELNLPSLQWLDLWRNSLSSLPELNLPSLQRLYLRGNQDLSELPMSLGNSAQLTCIVVESIQISQANADAILRLCRSRRNANAAQNLPELLNLWSHYAGKLAGRLQFVLNFSDREKIEIHEWLVRLSRTRDFRGRQHALAAIVYSMLADLSNSEFRSLFFAQIELNNEACQDRAAMALNELYVAWRLLVPREEMTRQDKLRLLEQAAKTIALRAVLSSLPGVAENQENVEIYLYYETALQSRLGLLTAIETMSYASLGKRNWINENQLVDQVNAQYLDHVVEMSIFNELFSNDPDAVLELKQISQPFESRLAALEEQMEKQELNEQQYTTACGQCMRDREQAQRNFKKEWFVKQLSPGANQAI